MDESVNQNELYATPEGEFDQDLEFDFDDEDFDDNADLMRVLAMAGGAAAALGGLIILLTRRRETPAERVVAQIQATGKEVRKAVARADLAALLSGALDQVNSRVQSADVQDLVKAARRSGQQAAAHVDLEAAVSDVRDRLHTIEHEGRRGAKRAQKEAQRAFKNLDLGDVSDEARQQLKALWDQIAAQAQDVGWDQALKDSRKQIRHMARDLRHQAGGVQTADVAAVLATLAEHLGSMRKQVEEDVLPQVQGTLNDDVLPEARKRARQAGEALSAVAQEARKRGGKLADEYGPTVKEQAGQAAEGAKGFAAQAGDILRTIAIDALNRTMNDILPAARKGGGQAAQTMRNDTLPWIRHRADEARTRVQEDVAPRVAEAAADAPGKVRDAVGTAAPVVGEALSSAAGAIGEVVSRARPQIAAQPKGVGGALSSVGRKAGDAVNNTVDTTLYVTGETGRIIFWLSMLAGLMVAVFIPDREKQQEIWNDIQQFLGELRNMWSDLSADDFDFASDQDDTADTAM